MADDVGKLTIITSSPTLISIKHQSGNKNSNLESNPFKFESQLNRLFPEQYYEIDLKEQQ